MKPILVVKDRALDMYGTPMTNETTAQAVRGFTDEANRNDGQSAIAAHPDDYDLYLVGHYEPQTGRLLPLSAPELVVRAKDLIRPKGE